MLILHIGNYKTGSTAIQHALDANRDRLAAQGFCYPRGGVERNHGDVARFLAEPDGAPPAVRAEAERIRAEAFAAAGKVIISSEGFSSLRPARLREWCGDAEAKVVIYLREQAETIASRYQQQVKAALMARSFEAFAEGLVYDYVGQLASWEAAFGRENLLAFAYPADAVAHFLGVLGIDATGWRPLAADPNPSIAGALLEAKRRLNATFTGCAKDMMRLTWESLIDMARSEPRFRGRVGASDAILADIRGRHRNSNEALAKRFGVAFAERPWIAPAFEEADVRAALDELMRRSPRLGATRAEHWTSS